MTSARLLRNIQVSPLGLSQVQVLIHLHAGLRKNSEIAAAAGISPSNVAACRTRLLHAGHIDIHANPTPQGLETLSGIFQAP
jgi:DNA-binding MarR family transcriptional regulator